jgi:hypothetical protein
VAVRVSFAPTRASPAAIAEALVPLRDDLSLCVARVQRRPQDPEQPPAVHGTLVARFALGADGALVPQSLGLEGSLTSEAARRCLATALERMHTPALDADATAALRLVFHAPPPPDRRGPLRPGDADTLFDFLGCGGALR